MRPRRRGFGLTAVFVTIDTEYSVGLHQQHAGADGAQADNFSRSIAGAMADGTAGVGYQLDVLDAHGLKAVFFVDPLPALVWGRDAIAAIIAPIVARGHDVQLHAHTEWLAHVCAADSPVAGRQGRNIKDFTLADQVALLRWSRDMLIAAGAPSPVAFRAGNYGANDDTLRALAEIGIAYDSSHCPALVGDSDGDCAIALGRGVHHPLRHCGVVEVPVGSIDIGGGVLRHAQITALSAAEMLAAIAHARDAGAPSFTMVSHSFELVNRARTRVNRLLMRRFEALCAGIAAMPEVVTATYADAPPRVVPANDSANYAPLPHRRLRSWARMAEQVAANMLYR